MDMEPLGGGYTRAEGVVYFGEAKVPGSEASSFKYLGGCWARDANRVYSSGSVLRSADTSTFMVLSYIFAKDGQQVYYLGGKVDGVDAPSFEALDSGCHFAAPGKHPVSYAGYGRDCASVFHHVLTIGKACVVRGADRATFRSLEGTYGLDGAAVFVDKRRIKGADPSSWFRLQGLYSRDAETIFYDDRVVEGADESSFICLWGAYGTWAKDATSYYDIGRPASQDAYLEVLAHETEHLAKIRASLLAGRL